MTNIDIEDFKNYIITKFRLKDITKLNYYITAQKLSLGWSAINNFCKEENQINRLFSYLGVSMTETIERLSSEYLIYSYHLWVQLNNPEIIKKYGGNPFNSLVFIRKFDKQFEINWEEFSVRQHSCSRMLADNESTMSKFKATERQ